MKLLQYICFGEKIYKRLGGVVKMLALFVEIILFKKLELGSVPVAEY